MIRSATRVTTSGRSASAPRPVVAHAPPRTASSDARTSCTRTPHAPAAAASADVAAVAASRPSGGRGAPSASASSAPRNRLRDAPTSTGKPQPVRTPVIDGSARSSAQLCSAFLANPRPGSSTSASATRRPRRRRPPCASSSARTRRPRRRSAASSSISALCPRQCIRIHGHPGVGDDRGHLRVGEAAGHVVDDPRRRPRARRPRPRRGWCRCCTATPSRGQRRGSPAAPGRPRLAPARGARPAGSTRRRRRPGPRRRRAAHAARDRGVRGRGTGRRRRTSPGSR